MSWCASPWNATPAAVATPIVDVDRWARLQRQRAGESIEGAVSRPSSAMYASTAATRSSTGPPISMYPKLWQASGLSYRDLLDELVRLALERHARRRRNTNR